MTGNPVRPNPDDPTEVTWSQAVSSHVVRTYATVAARDTDNPSPHPGQAVSIVTAGGGAIVQVYDGAAWRTMPGATAVGYGAFTALAAWDNGWMSQVPQFAPVSITKRGPTGVTRLLVGAWLSGCYATAGGAGLVVAVGNDVGGPSGDAATAQLVEVGRGQVQAAPGVSIGGWNVMDRAHGARSLAVFWQPVTAGARINAGLGSCSLVVMEIGA